MSGPIKGIGDASTGSAPPSCDLLYRCSVALISRCEPFFDPLEPRSPLLTRKKPDGQDASKSSIKVPFDGCACNYDVPGGNQNSPLFC